MAVLDWEMATVGDPLMDLGTTLAYWVDPDDPPALRAAGFVDVTSQPGSLRRREVAERYAARDAGATCPGCPSTTRSASSRWRSSRSRSTRGSSRATRRDPRFARLDAAVAACASAAARVAETGRIDELGT